MTIPVFHVYTRGGGKDRRFRWSRGGFRTSSNVLLCGATITPETNTISRESGEAVKRHAARGIEPTGYRVCSDCLGRISLGEPKAKSI